jgi:hypothetical protein
MCFWQSTNLREDHLTINLLIQIADNNYCKIENFRTKKTGPIVNDET